MFGVVVVLLMFYPAFNTLLLIGFVRQIEQFYNYQLGVYYMDFVSECEKLGDYLMNVVQAGLNKNNDYEDKPLKR